MTGTSGNITVEPCADGVAFTVANPGTQTAGTAFSETITAADPYGNTASGYTGNQTLTFSGPANSPNGKSPTYPGSVNFTNGVGTATITLYDAQTTTLTAAATTPPHRHLDQLHGQPRSAGLRSRCRTPAPRRPGTTFSVTITAIDAYGNAATSYSGPQTLAFSGPANSPNGTAPVYPASVTFTSGVGTASITLYDAQTTSLTATQGGATGTSGTSRSTGRATVGTFTVSNPGTQTAGTAFNVTITAADPYGNPIVRLHGHPGRHLQRSIQLAERHAPTYPASVTFTGGVGTASITLYDAQTTTLTATATGPD